GPRPIHGSGGDGSSPGLSYKTQIQRGRAVPTPSKCFLRIGLGAGLLRNTMNAALFAQSSAPAGLAAWLACAAFLLMLANQAFRLKERLLGESSPRQIFPQPLEVRPARDPVSREHCDGNYQASTRRIEAIEQELGELRDE